MLALKDIWEDDELGCSVSAAHYSVVLFHFYYFLLGLHLTHSTMYCMSLTVIRQMTTL